MSDLIIADRYGRELGLSHHFRKAPEPKKGDVFGLWSGHDSQFAKLPGGAVLQFDLSRLTLADFRVMRDHYQINASLTLLTFMLHQIDWDIKCEDKKIADFVRENLHTTWTRLIRALSQAFWAGFSPTVIDYENDVEGKRIVVNKFKDLVPEECLVNWKQIEGWSPPGSIPPKLYEYDGIKQYGVQFPIPAENTLWYPLLMENGNYYGRKLLKPAFPAWFFSQLIHLFSNRYFERFGEPVPVGRADFDSTVTVGGESVTGRDAMETILTQFRNRAVVVLPSDRDPDTKEYDYDIEYLESQMRGADFERYMSRLDEEMSIGLFTPILLFRTGDTGSYNLGVSHLTTYLWSLNALANDMKEYIDRFVVERLKALNFSPKAPRCEWVPRRLGRDNAETLRAIIQSGMSNGTMKVDTEELGQALGLKVEEVEVLTSNDGVDDPNGPNDPNDPSTGAPPPRQPKNSEAGGQSRPGDSKT